MTYAWRDASAAPASAADAYPRRKAQTRSTSSNSSISVAIQHGVRFLPGSSDRSGGPSSLPSSGAELLCVNRLDCIGSSYDHATAVWEAGALAVVPECAEAEAELGHRLSRSTSVPPGRHAAWRRLRSTADSLDRSALPARRTQAKDATPGWVSRLSRRWPSGAPVARSMASRDRHGAEISGGTTEM